MNGWWWSDGVGGFPCTVCGRELVEGEVYYTPREPDDEQIAMLEQLFGGDPLADFAACEQCVRFNPFDWWLDEQWESRFDVEVADSTHNWLKEGF